MRSPNYESNFKNFPNGFSREVLFACPMVRQVTPSGGGMRFITHSVSMRTNDFNFSQGQSITAFEGFAGEDFSPAFISIVSLHLCFSQGVHTIKIYESLITTLML